MARICFKTGPPRAVGIELEWLLHHRTDPTRPVTITDLALTASAAEVLRTGRLTVEPGGQLELSSDPFAGPGRLHGGPPSRCRRPPGRAHVLPDWSSSGSASTRTARRSASWTPRGTPRWSGYFDRSGSAGRTMMCSHRLRPDQPRRRARGSDARSGGPADPLGPAARTGPRPGGRLRQLPGSRRAGRPAALRPARRSGPRSTPARTRPVRRAGDAIPGELGALRPGRPRAVRDRPEAGRGPSPPDSPSATGSAATARARPAREDLDYHLTTLFPPVRPRGHLELRTIDAQRGEADWAAALALVWALVTDPAAARRGSGGAEPVAGDPRGRSRGPPDGAQRPRNWRDGRRASASRRPRRRSGPLGAPGPARRVWTLPSATPTAAGARPTTPWIPGPPPRTGGG